MAGGGGNVEASDNDIQLYLPDRLPSGILLLLIIIIIIIVIVIVIIIIISSLMCTG